MKNNVYLKSSFRDIKASLGRFISIILIILMGVLLFVGIKSVGPDLEATGNQFIQQKQLSDLQIISTGGLTQKDRALVKQLKYARVELGYSFPYLDKANQKDIQVYSLGQKQNHLTPTKGRLPKKSSEIVVDQKLASKKLKLGSTLKINNQQLKRHNYKIVGFVQSPLYIDNDERGVTTIGDGQVDGFAYLPKAAFKTQAYSLISVRFSDLDKMNAFSTAYQTKLNKKTDQLRSLFAKRAQSRKVELQATANRSIAKNEQKLQNQQTTLTAANTQLNQQLAALTSANQQQSTAGRQIQAQQATLAGQQKQLTAAKQKLTAAKTKSANLAKPSYLLNDRQTNPGFAEFQSLANRIDAIANIFPVFFFFIAILITFTSMTRMVEEKRKEIGTLKALGYRNSEIAVKYILYAFLAAFTGVVLGVLIGAKLLPVVVFTILKARYIFTDYPLHFYFTPIVLATIAALIATLGSSLGTLLRDLREKPAELLVAKAPKVGKRILLERITPLWSRFSFNQKITYRNLFRYKSRMILTILGIAGCTGLMLAGFGLKDSISAPVEKQFSEIMHYDLVVTLNAKTNAAQPNAAQTVLKKSNAVKHTLPVFSEQVTFKKTNTTDQNANLFVTSNAKKFAQYVTLKPAGKSPVKLTNQGAVINQHLAELYHINPGDHLTMQLANGKSVRLRVSQIGANYIGHNIYMTAKYYKQVAATSSPANTYLVKTNDHSLEQLTKNLHKVQSVIGTTSVKSQIEQQNKTTASLNSVVLIFIVLSGTLAFVVLYNLTNINISERMRELSTIKVLGFFDNEVTMYIVRENIILTLFGTLFGFGVGNALTWAILKLASSDTIVFPLIIHGTSYVIAGLMTFVFSAIVLIATHFNLKHIDMLAALKAND
ncbi:hypothetical protein BSQ39_11415 [Loigolactobacillus backii]|uniref:FtsX-like permease family protein n=1 Tax=Loigolactobacillus backii TaxID=375175 RepID=UPI000C1CA711|nr:FtsX-like permease family protein [Loigolactobacillus backii]PIO84124.1 hypothetical protein BSQ39_11415 [Loigolactobacillus backii]